MILLIFLIVFLNYEESNAQKLPKISLEMQNKLMETIFKNVTNELINYDWNHAFSNNITMENFVEKYNKQMNLELNKLMNEIFLVNVKNYVRNYTNQMKEVFIKGLKESDKTSFPLEKIIKNEDIQRLNDKLYELILELKGMKYMDLIKNKTNDKFNETEKYFVGNEIIKGVVRYYLTQNKQTGNFTTKVIKSFDFSKAIEFKFKKIEQEAENLIHFIKLHGFIHNNSVIEENIIENEILFNVTFDSLVPDIKNGKVLIEFDNILNNKGTENVEFIRNFQSYVVIYVGILIFLTVLICLFLIKMSLNIKKLINYETC